MQTTLNPPTDSGTKQPLRIDYSRIAQDLQVRKGQVESVVELLDAGCTIPFITRYRKEQTGGLDEEALRRIQKRVVQLRQLNDRKASILKVIESRGQLTEELRKALLNAETNKRLEDLYLPFKPKKRTLASVARERGLEPLADAIWSEDPAVGSLDELLPTMVNPEKELNTPEDVLQGVTHILAERISEQARVRAPLRFYLWDHAKLKTSKHPKLKEGSALDFKDYFEFGESIRTIPPHRILAVNRGERGKVLNVKLDFDEEQVQKIAWNKLHFQEHRHSEFLQQVTNDAVSRLILPSLEREVRRELREVAEDHAVSVFARNLSSLLLMPPLQDKRVLGIDPGFRSGCKIVALDETGNVLEHGIIFPHPPQKRRDHAKRKLESFVRKHQLDVIAIGNGTACRESEELVSEMLSDLTSRGGEGEPPLPKVEVQKAPEEKKEPEAKTEEAPKEEQATPEATKVESEAATPETTDAPKAEAEVTTPEAQESSAPAEAKPEETSEAKPEEAPEAATTVEKKPEEATPPTTEAKPEEAQESSASAEEKPEKPKQEKPKRKKREEEKVELLSLPKAPDDLAYVVVNEAGASVYSASVLGKEELPEYDATTRGTVSIGRRLQDPLSELVKIDPQSIGVGLYQHDVNEKTLKESLEGVVESCVNTVGVDLTTASVPLLRYVSGLNQLVAQDIVRHRQENGPFRNREQLKSVKGIGETRYVQAAGFLKIRGGDNPLDQTWIHPESYGAAEQLLQELGFDPSALNDAEKLKELRAKLKEVKVPDVAQRLGLGEMTCRDVIAALSRPDRDPRDDVPPPVFRKGILRIEDLEPGMELKGTILNVVDFGAFVDVGLKDSGLVHISQMANRFVKNPYELVSVGDVVKVWVLKVDQERGRVSLSMLAPGTQRERPQRRERSRPPREGDQPQGEKRPERRRDGNRDDRQKSGDRRPPRGRGQRGDQRREKRPEGELPRRGERRMEGGPKKSRAKPKSQEAPQAQGGEGKANEKKPAPRPARKPKRRPPKPNLSSEQIQGESPLGTFAELAALWSVKDEPPKKEEAPKPEAEEAPTPETPTNEESSSSGESDQATNENS